MARRQEKCFISEEQQIISVTIRYATLTPPVQRENLPGYRREGRSYWYTPDRSQLDPLRARTTYADVPQTTQVTS